MKVMVWMAGSLHMTEAFLPQMSMLYRARVLGKQSSPKPLWQLLGLVSYELQERISQRIEVLERTFILGGHLRENR